MSQNHKTLRKNPKNLFYVNQHLTFAFYSKRQSVYRRQISNDFWLPTVSELLLDSALRSCPSNKWSIHWLRSKETDRISVYLNCLYDISQRVTLSTILVYLPFCQTAFFFLTFLFPSYLFSSYINCIERLLTYVQFLTKYWNNHTEKKCLRDGLSIYKTISCLM